MKQSYIIDIVGLPEILHSVAFPWKLTIAVIISALVCAMGTPKAKTAEAN